MKNQSSFMLRGRNPDVLTCIANLSSDEVFTPPDLANRMLDSLANIWAHNNKGANIWTDSSVTFLDPCTKSGVFLREITKRLTEGLQNEIPDLQKRVDHILTKQVFGIGITHLTSLLARRSLYCSKNANGKHSISKSFSNLNGNIWFENIRHQWVGVKCKYCGAPKKFFDRDVGLESHAYSFIHTSDINDQLNLMFGGIMKFDVIIGNPPYQLKGGAGGTSDSSIYHLFIEQAQKLKPKFLSMVVPSRWLAGGRGLDRFRKEMLSSQKIIQLVDFPVSKEVFPNVEVKGGICYFLWSDTYKGQCDVTLIRSNESISSLRKLDEFDVFVRHPMAIEILRKVLKLKEESIIKILTADTPFGIATNFTDYHDKRKNGDVALYYKDRVRSIGFVPQKMIRKNEHLIKNWKVLVPKSGSDGGQKIPDSVLGKPWISPPPSVATQTFLAFYVNSEKEALSLESYYKTKFFRFLVSLRKITQDALRPMYLWVPIQEWNQQWTDKALYKKYKLTSKEINYIETVIRVMDTSIDGEN